MIREKRQPGVAVDCSRFDLSRPRESAMLAAMDELTTILSEPIARLGATTITLGHALAVGAVAVRGAARWRWSSRCGVRRAPGRSPRPKPPSRRATPKRAWPTSCRRRPRCRAAWAPSPKCSARARPSSTSSIGQRLDAMTGRLGQTMTEQTRSTHESLRQAAGAAGRHRHRARQHPVARRAGRAAAGDPVQQADARRLRPGAHGGDRRRRPADGRLRVPGDAFQRQPARLHHPDAERRAVAGRSTPSSRWKRGTPSAPPKAPTRRRSRRRPSAATSKSISATSPRNT